MLSAELLGYAAGMANQPSLPLLTRALQQTGELIARTKPDQSELPTPCPEFNLRALVNHTVFDLRRFRQMIGGPDAGSPDADLLGNDWRRAYDTASQELLDQSQQRGTDGTLQSRMGELPAMWAVGQHLSDIAVHGWDIARATKQQTELDPEVGEVGLAWGRQSLKPEYRGQAFGPEVSVSDSAPVYDRLAAFFGRTP
jgi:uncharacterized protein (TIGR03086 family)